MGAAAAVGAGAGAAVSEDRIITIDMPAPEGWPGGQPWDPAMTLRAHLADDGALYVAPLGSPDYPGPAIRAEATGLVEWPLWIDAASDPLFAGAPRAWGET